MVRFRTKRYLTLPFSNTRANLVRNRELRYRKELLVDNAEEDWRKLALSIHESYDIVLGKLKQSCSAARLFPNLPEGQQNVLRVLQEVCGPHSVVVRSYAHNELVEQWPRV